jgi:hypothetical protein
MRDTCGRDREEARERMWAALARRADAAVVIVTHLADDADRATRILAVTSPAGPS